MSTPAEDHATEQGLPVVAVPTFDLLRAAGGHPLIVRTLDGAEVLLRLMTVDEMVEANRAAVESMPEWARPPMMTRGDAVRIVAPVSSF